MNKLKHPRNLPPFLWILSVVWSPWMSKNMRFLLFRKRNKDDLRAYVVLLQVGAKLRQGLSVPLYLGTSSKHSLLSHSRQVGTTWPFSSTPCCTSFFIRLVWLSVHTWVPPTNTYFRLQLSGPHLICPLKLDCS